MIRLKKIGGPYPTLLKKNKKIADIFKKIVLPRGGVINFLTPSLS